MLILYSTTSYPIPENGQSVNYIYIKIPPDFETELYLLYLKTKWNFGNYAFSLLSTFGFLKRLIIANTVIHGVIIKINLKTKLPGVELDNNPNPIAVETKTKMIVTIPNAILPFLLIHISPLSGLI